MFDKPHRFFRVALFAVLALALLAGTALVAAAQVASGFAAVNDAQQDSIFGNTATKIIMKLGDFSSAELMAKTIGQELALFASTSTANTTGRSAAWVSRVTITRAITNATRHASNLSQ